MADKHPRSRDGLFKRGGSPYWQCWIRGQRRSTKCRDREAARTVKAKLERAVADPSYLAAHEAALGGAVTDFLEHFKTRDRSEDTANMYRVKCGHIIRIIGEGTKLATIGEGGSQMADAYVKQRVQAEGAKHTTVGKELTAFRQVLLLAKKHRAFPFDLDGVMPTAFSVNYVPKKRALSWEEFVALVPEVARFHKKHAGMVVFFVALGPRKSEAERARGEDIDWSNWTVQIRGSKTDASDDEVAIAEPFRAMFSFWVPRKTGELWGVWANMTRDLAAACKRLGIERVTANDLRRSHGKLLRTAGASVDVVARQLRHVDSKLAEKVYAKLTARETGALLGAQLGATGAMPSPGEHCHYQHNDGWPSELSACVQGQNRTVDTRIFKPSVGLGQRPAITDFQDVPVSPGSDASPVGAGLPATNSTGQARYLRALAWGWFRRAA